MSGPKTRCPSCGTEWDGPVVFCGECGARFTSPDAPPKGRGGFGKSTLGSIPAARVPSKPSAPQKPIIGGATAKPAGVGSLKATLIAPPKTADSPPPAARTADSESKQAPALNKKGRRGSAPDLSVSVEVSDTPISAPISFSEIGAPAARPQTSTSAVEPSVGGPVAHGPAAAGGPGLVSRPTLTSAVAAPPTPSTPPASPSSPPKGRVSSPPLHDETARMLEDLDAGFESIVRPPTTPAHLVDTPVAPARGPSSSGHPPPIPRVDAPPAEAAGAREARHQADMTEVRELFAGIAVAYARPMRDFMLEVAWGDPTRDWIEVALPATQSLRRAATAVELPGVDGALEGFQAALELAMGEPAVSTEVREMLAGAYARLIDALPSVFALEGERVRREPIIVRSLLLQVPGVHHVALEKLYRAGIHGLDVLYAARPRDLADATGLDETVAAAICERFQRYRREIAELAPGRDRARERAELTALVDELSRHQLEHEAAAASWAKDATARRIRARKDRDDAMIRVDLLLARLGEIDLQRSIAKLPFQRRIRELYRFLDEASQRAGRS